LLLSYSRLHTNKCSIGSFFAVHISWISVDCPHDTRVNPVHLFFRCGCCIAIPRSVAARCLFLFPSISSSSASHYSSEYVLINSWVMKNSLPGKAFDAFKW
jgi:hypothetical protein